MVNTFNPKVYKFNKTMSNPNSKSDYIVIMKSKLHIYNKTKKLLQVLRMFNLR